jgi:hypothetical protein
MFEDTGGRYITRPVGAAAGLSSFFRRERKCVGH